MRKLRTLLLLGGLLMLMLVATAVGPPDEVDLRDPPRGPILFYDGEDGEVKATREGEVTTTEEPNGDIRINYKGGDGKLRITSEGEIVVVDEPPPYTPRSHWSCLLSASTPVRSGSQMRSAGYIYCWGSGVQQTRLKVALQKHRYGPVWNTLDFVHTQWLNTGYISRSVSDPCLSGTYTYRTVSDGWIRHTGGTSRIGPVVSSHNQETC